MIGGLMQVGTLLDPIRRRLGAPESLAQDVADFARGLELTLLRQRDDAAAITEALLAIDIDPGNPLIDARRDLDMVRQVNPDALIEAYLDKPEVIRAQFRNSGRRDRENAERITTAMVEMLATSRRSQ